MLIIQLLFQFLQFIALAYATVHKLSSFYYIVIIQYNLRILLVHNLLPSLF